MKQASRSGAALAVAAVSLALAAQATQASAAPAKPGKVHCFGVNSCKGKTDCMTPKNSCKGMNECKGQGWVFSESEKACKEQGGKVVD